MLTILIMGYDDGECVLCYSKYGCNNGVSESRAKTPVCFGCIDVHFDEFTTRMVYPLIHWEKYASYEVCNICKIKKTSLLLLPLCEDCESDIEV